MKYKVGDVVDIKVEYVKKEYTGFSIPSSTTALRITNIITNGNTYIAYVETMEGLWFYEDCLDFSKNTKLKAEVRQWLK